MTTPNPSSPGIAALLWSSQTLGHPWVTPRTGKKAEACWLKAAGLVERDVDHACLNVNTQRWRGPASNRVFLGGILNEVVAMVPALAGELAKVVRSEVVDGKHNGLARHAPHVVQHGGEVFDEVQTPKGDNVL
eukprot:TRINITY_DN12145_c0_g1_i15.p2 TRINITY_DN12145_c0_g1~~TRINITY_DN12145_c0_g1_i15.p2  ORF type:complete len:133 (+),score=5.83 TRINITY_DN12145_c0_g1_i15:300-698(+)